jgi:hypothetical protein
MKRAAWMQRPGCVWAAAGAAGGLIVLTAALVLTALSRGPAGRAPSDAPVVTLLPRPTATVAATAPPSPMPTETPPPAAPEDGNTGRVGVGSIVAVSGTEGDGLRLRADPSTTGTIRLLAGESEVFTVQEGPVDAEGRTWFYIVSPSDAARAGWAVADYLRLAQ